MSGRSRKTAASIIAFAAISAYRHTAELFKTLALSHDDKIPMWLKHNKKKWMGVQYHPESFLTADSDLHLKALSDWLAT